MDKPAPSPSDGWRCLFLDNCRFIDQAAAIPVAAEQGAWGGVPPTGDSTVGSLSPWDIGHICDKPARGGFGFTLKSGHSILDLVGHGYVGQSVERDWRRDKVTIWSRQSRARLMKQVSAIDWDSLQVVFIVLTWGKHYPASGKEAHEQVRSFWRAWERKFGSRPAAVWKKEFQKRGVIHYSMWVSISDEVQLEGLNSFVHETWYGIAGYGDLDHLYHGAYCQLFEGSPLAYLLKECFARSKEYQNIPPPGYHTGRWWGFIGGLAPTWGEQELTFDQGVKLRRLLGRYLRSKGYKRRFRGSIQGVWASMLPSTRARMISSLGVGRES